MTGVRRAGARAIPNVADMDHTTPRPVPAASRPPTDTRPRLSLGLVGIGVRVLAAVAILIVANVVGPTIIALVLAIPGALEVFGGTSPWGFALAAARQASVLGIVVLAMWAWMRWIERAPLRAAGWRWDRLSIAWLALGVVVAGGTVFAVTALLPATGAVVEDAALLGDQAGSPTAWLLVLYYLGLAFLQQGIPEELLFRGWLVWRLRHRPVIAVIVTTLAFTVIHLVSQGGQESAWEHVLYLALPFGFSLLAVGLLLWTGSLWAAIGVHGGFHIGNYLAVGLLPQVDPVTSWLAVGGVQAALGIVLTVTALRRGRRIDGFRG